MKILLFKKTTDKDLYKGLQVCYQDINGAFTKLGVITDILTDKDGIKNYLINTSMGAYMADELKLIAPEKVNIKEQNYWSIKDFAMSRNRPEMQGSKLKALFYLIEKKGELIQTEDKKLNGLKALQISANEWVAIKRIGIKDSFYPCMLQTYFLSQL